LNKTGFKPVFRAEEKKDKLTIRKGQQKTTDKNIEQVKLSRNIKLKKIFSVWDVREQRGEEVNEGSTENVRRKSKLEIGLLFTQRLITFALSYQARPIGTNPLKWLRKGIMCPHLLLYFFSRNFLFGQTVERNRRW
jgi:hypothetical protein